MFERSATTDILAAMMKEAFPRLWLELGLCPEFFLGDDRLLIRDARRQLLAAEMSIGHLPSSLRRTECEDFLRDIRRRAIAAVSAYEHLVDAFEGRRPVVWS